LLKKVNTVAGLVIQANICEQDTQYHQKRAAGIINVTRDRGRGPWQGVIVPMCMGRTVKKEARQENSEERPINHSNSKMRRYDRENKANGMPTYLSGGGRVANTRHLHDHRVSASISATSTDSNRRSGNHVGGNHVIHLVAVPQSTACAHPGWNAARSQDARHLITSGLG